MLCFLVVQATIGVGINQLHRSLKLKKFAEKKSIEMGEDLVEDVLVGR